MINAPAEIRIHDSILLNEASTLTAELCKIYTTFSVDNFTYK